MSIGYTIYIRDLGIHMPWNKFPCEYGKICTPLNSNDILHLTDCYITCYLINSHDILHLSVSHNILLFVDDQSILEQRKK